LYQYNDVYSRESDTRVYVDKPLNYLATLIHDTKVQGSSVKISNEQIDSWTIFPYNSFIELDSGYGPLCRLINFNDQVVFLQHNGLGLIAINEKSVVKDEIGNQLTLAGGDAIGDFKYLSTTNGTRHHDSVVPTQQAIFYMDTSSRAIMQFTGEGNIPLSEVKGIRSYLKAYVSGEMMEDENLIHAVYDRSNHRVIFCFTSFTVSYNELLQAFESFLSYTPYHFLSIGEHIMSADNNQAWPNTIYRHGAGNPGWFYNDNYSTSVEFTVNQDYDLVKVFTNLEFDMSAKLNGLDDWDETLDNIVVFNDYQVTAQSRDLRRRMRTWRFTIPRDTRSVEHQTGGRIRDHYAKIRMVYSNDTGHRIFIPGIITYYIEINI
jgi:hypothetical protein